MSPFLSPLSLSLYPFPAVEHMHQLHDVLLHYLPLVVLIQTHRHDHIHMCMCKYVYTKIDIHVYIYIERES